MNYVMDRVAKDKREERTIKMAAEFILDSETEDMLYEVMQHRCNVRVMADYLRICFIDNIEYSNEKLLVKIISAINEFFHSQIV